MAVGRLGLQGHHTFVPEGHSDTFRVSECSCQEKLGRLLGLESFLR